MQTTTNKTTTTEQRSDVQKALDELEQVAGEVRVKMHLAELDVRELWSTKLEPRLFEARQHAKDASSSSKAAIDATIAAFREFAQSL